MEMQGQVSRQIIMRGPRKPTMTWQAARPSARSACMTLPCWGPSASSPGSCSANFRPCREQPVDQPEVTQTTP